MPVSMPPRAFRFQDGQEPIELTPEQYDRFVLLSAGEGLEGRPGQRLPPLKEAVRNLMQSRGYRDERLSDAGRIALIRDQMIGTPESPGYRELAKMQLREEFPELDEKINAREARRAREFLETGETTPEQTQGRQLLRQLGIQ